MAKELSDQHKLFVTEYLIDLNATQAAIRAGYSEKTARVQGPRLLQNVAVAAAIAEGAKKRFASRGITADRVIEELGKLAFFDPRKLFNDDGRVKQISELDDETAAVVAGLEVYEEYEGSGENRTAVGQTKKFKLADKGANLERLGRYFKLFTDKHEHTGSVNVIRTSIPRPAR